MSNEEHELLIEKIARKAVAESDMAWERRMTKEFELHAATCPTKQKLADVENQIKGAKKLVVGVGIVITFVSGLASKAWTFLK